jgi:hypothetical protein
MMVINGSTNQLANKICPPPLLPMVKEDMALEFSFLNTMVYENYEL